MVEIDLRVIESPIVQRSNEAIIYSIDTSPWGGSPTSPSFTITDEDGTDTSATNLSGSASVSGDSVLSPSIISITAGTHYQVIGTCTIGGNTFSFDFDLVGI